MKYLSVKFLLIKYLDPCRFMVRYFLIYDSFDLYLCILCKTIQYFDSVAGEKLKNVTFGMNRTTSISEICINIKSQYPGLS